MALWSCVEVRVCFSFEKIFEQKHTFRRKDLSTIFFFIEFRANNTLKMNEKTINNFLFSPQLLSVNGCRRKVHRVWEIKCGNVEKLWWIVKVSKLTICCQLPCIVALLCILFFYRIAAFVHSFSTMKKSIPVRREWSILDEKFQLSCASERERERV